MTLCRATRESATSRPGRLDGGQPLTPDQTRTNWFTLRTLTNLHVDLVPIEFAARGELEDRCHLGHHDPYRVSSQRPFQTPRRDSLEHQALRVCPEIT